MKAAVLFESPGTLSIEDVTVGTLGRHEVRIRIAATGLCHSDLHHLLRGTYLPLPMVPGHEASGVVEAVGDDVTYLAPGDHVVTSCRGFCGSCEFCLTGRPTLCDQTTLRRGPGDAPRLTLSSGRPCSQIGGLGTFAEEALVHENALVKIDRDIPLDRAALLGCGVLTGVGSVIHTAKVHPGANVAVIGCGGVGLNVIQGAVIAGANHVIAVDIDDRKLELAKQFGATDTLNSATQDVREQIEAILPGKGGVDYSFEALGRKETCEQAFAMLRRGGTATIVGTFHGTFEIPGIPLLDDRKVQGSAFGSVDFRRDVAYFLDLYRSGRLKLDELISERLPLQDINGAFDRLAGGGVTRSIVTFPH